MNKGRAYSPDAGFTLLEALIATLLMSLIFAALATVTAQWLPNWNRGLLALQRSVVTAESLDRLTKDLADAEFISAGTTDPLPIFDGAELSVTFVRTKLAPNAGPGIEVVRIAEIGDETGPVLVRGTAPLPTDSADSASAYDLEFANQVVLVRSPYRVSFSYAGADRVWRNDWHAQAELPRTIRIQVRDNATARLLNVSTSTLVHAQLPARCTWAKTIADCPGLAAQAEGSTASANGVVGSH